MEPEYYRLPKAAEMLGYSTDELLNFGVTGKIPIIVLITNKAGYLLDKHLNSALEIWKPEVIKDKYGFVTEQSLAVYESERGTGKKPELAHVLKNDNSGQYWRFIESDFIPLDENTLYILTSDINRLRVRGNSCNMDWVSNGLDKHLHHFCIADLWATSTTGEASNSIREEKTNQISQAIVSGELAAIVEERVPGFDDGFKEITDKNRIRKIKDGCLNNKMVQFTIHRDAFRSWLEKTNQYPLTDGCLLAKWFDSEPQTEPLADDGQDNQEDTSPNERELKQGLRDIWIKEGRPEMKVFFPAKLKKYINQPGSPITQVYSSGQDAGISYKTSYGTTGTLKKKTLSNYVTAFKNTP